MSDLVSGMLAAGYLVAGLHFLKFHHRTRDRLFLLFAVSFWTLAAQRLGVALLADESSATLWLYAVRAGAFLLIIYAIVDKNRAPSGPRARSPN